MPPCSLLPHAPSPATMHILALSGSLRTQSTNSRMLRAAALLAPPSMTFTFHDHQLALLPAFNPDLDGEGAVPPPAVAAFRALLASADGILMCVPEYAAGVPGAFKNALDWVVSSGELTHKPVALLMASPSGARMAHAALTPTLRMLGAALVFEDPVPVMGRPLAEDLTILDAGLKDAVMACLAALVAAPRHAE